MQITSIILASCMSIFANAIYAEEIGSIDTAFKVLGANHKIVIDVLDDSIVQVSTSF